MRIISILKKSLKEQLRNFWIVLLSLSMGPFFIFVYYLINESSTPQYKVIVVNNDAGINANGQTQNKGRELFSFFKQTNTLSDNLSFTLSEMTDREAAVAKLKNKDADALVVIPSGFSAALSHDSTVGAPKLEFVGDLTSANYLLSAVWANEVVNKYARGITQTKRIIEVAETPLGSSGTINQFDMLVPGILIVSLIMLLFTASIAFVSEVENKTIMRLKLSKITVLDFLGGVGAVQFLLGIAGMLLTLLTAVLLGFEYQGSLVAMLVIAGLCCLSLIAFSLIVAAVTKSANEVLVVGNFPMFLFMFFTGAAFPIKSDAWFYIADYPVNLQALLSPTPAISALNKIFIMDMPFGHVLPELIAISVLTLVYFAIGAYLFHKRHLKS